MREAVAAFGEKTAPEDEYLLNALADTMIETTANLLQRIEEVEKRLNETHALLEGTR